MIDLFIETFEQTNNIDWFFHMAQYMEKYNSKRVHSAIENKTPNEVYFKAINNNLLQKVV